MNFLHRIPLFFFNILCPLKIWGKENIPQGKAVIVSNHFHALDCAFLAEVYPKDIYFLAKKEIFKNKIAAACIKWYGGIPVDRENPDMKTLISAIRVLKDGHKLAIFPEGTRNKTGTTDLQSIKGGAIVLAVKAKSPIVPIMMNRKLGLFKKTHIIVGKPFELDEFYGQKLTDDVVKHMESIVFGKMVEQQKILFEIISKKKKNKKGSSNESN
jgi:1-acyl-sn-glycerol-3-phosphate acyltransferase